MRELRNVDGEDANMVQNKHYIHRNNYNDTYMYLEPYIKHSSWKILFISFTLIYCKSECL